MYVIICTYEGDYGLKGGLMRASLIYDVDGKRYVLETFSIEILDQYTYRSFKNKDEIFSCSRYSDILSNLPRTGEFYLSVPYGELTVPAAQFLTVFGKNAFAEEQLFDVRYGDDEHAKVFTPRKYILGALSSDIDVFEEFYKKSYEFYTSQERFFHDIGMIYEDASLASKGVRRLLHEAIDSPYSYDVRRIIIDGIAEFDSVKNKGEVASHK